MKLRQLFTSLRQRSMVMTAVVAGGLALGGLKSDATASASRPFLYYDGRNASVPSNLPIPIHRAVQAANSLQTKPYRLGGGHRFLHDKGYDCSGSVSYVLHLAGLLQGPMTSGAFKNYGSPGQGRYITIFAKEGHVFLSICGLRFDTSDWGAGRGDGPRWRPKSRKFSGYEMRHPPGL